MSYWATQVTGGGHQLSEVISALQKHIRRGEEEQAMECAIQIESIQWKYLWNRLKVIASEDIGIADNSIAPLISALADNYEDARRRNNDSYRLFLGHAILAMCRAQKTRIVDAFIIDLYMRDEDWYEVPDYAFDKHTAKGRRLGRGIDHFFDEATKLNPEADIAGVERYTEAARRSLSTGRKWRYANAKAGGRRSTSTARRQEGTLFDD